MSRHINQKKNCYLIVILKIISITYDNNVDYGDNYNENHYDDDNIDYLLEAKQALLELEQFSSILCRDDQYQLVFPND